MARSSWKGPYVGNQITSDFSQIQRTLDKIHAHDPSDFSENQELVTKAASPKYIVYSRTSEVPQFLLGTSVQVYNGNKYFSFKITEEHIGKKFGEFSHTRKILMHKEVKKKKNIKK